MKSQCPFLMLTPLIISIDNVETFSSREDFSLSKTLPSFFNKYSWCIERPASKQLV